MAQPALDTSDDAFDSLPTDDAAFDSLPEAAGAPEEEGFSLTGPLPESWRKKLAAGLDGALSGGADELRDILNTRRVAERAILGGEDWESAKLAVGGQPDYARQAREENPNTALLGAILSPSPGAAGKGLVRVGEHALMGGVQGAAQTLGDGGNPLDAAKGALAGAAIRGTVGPVVDKIGNGFSAVAKWLGRGADNQALRVLGVEGKDLAAHAQSQGLNPEDAVGPLAQRAREGGLMEAARSSPRAAADAASGARGVEGDALAGFVDRFDALAAANPGALPNPQNAARQLFQKVQQLRSSGIAALGGEADELESVAMGLLQKGKRMSFRDFWEMRKTLDASMRKLLNAASKSGDGRALSLAQELELGVRRNVEGEMERAVGALDPSGLLSNVYRGQKALFQDANVLAEGAARRATQRAVEPLNRGGGLADEAAGLGRDMALRPGIGALRQAASGSPRFLQALREMPSVERGLSVAAGLTQGLAGATSFAGRKAADVGTRVAASRPTATQQVQQLLLTNPEAVPAAHREGLARALEKGEKHLATYLWAKASGGDAEFQRFYNGLLGNSLGVEASQ